MSYVTYACGTIDLGNTTKLSKMEIRKYLEEIYNMQQLTDIFTEEQITIDDEWDEFNRSDKFLTVMHKIAQVVHKDTNALIMCTGEREGDIWGIILKNNKIYTQRYELKPAGDAQEYDKVKKR